MSCELDPELQWGCHLQRTPVGWPELPPLENWADDGHEFKLLCLCHFGEGMEEQHSAQTWNTVRLRGLVQRSLLKLTAFI
ncbi:hypothetical protein P7K49_029955 [Saguinus oedipus]|uniref:Uncharacterized protein n=1 Tax=Saguinus oedipus TaxID=9490 RepID=A0ABQ9U951_SAGOE|nr:hypothetical protein P7K49_029955 [Saguinus oedipus]